jgi:hypothetical protein
MIAIVKPKEINLRTNLFEFVILFGGDGLGSVPTSGWDKGKASVEFSDSMVIIILVAIKDYFNAISHSFIFCISVLFVFAELDEVSRTNSFCGNPAFILR